MDAGTPKGAGALTFHRPITFRLKAGLPLDWFTRETPHRSPP